ncbi:hypothetical protein VHP8226_00512 [Vibrio hippocampi]|uniref:Uncharacterized protein n=1 Tax=Vibrio hippocampi TaxID=654686 RepID=A0ABN8DGV6_9VIBR|nr:hypothetical protein VHP8226_00512 [Vibrio hippocampi]
MYFQLKNQDKQKPAEKAGFLIFGAVRYVKP